MVGVILVTHGDMALGIKGAAEMIIGRQDKFSTVGLYAGESIDDLGRKVEDEIERISCREIILFTDMFGDTPTNVCTLISAQRDYTVITGVNLSMVLECLINRSKLKIDELIEHVAENGNSSIKVIKKDDFL